MPLAHPLASDLDDVLARTRHLWEELRGGRIFITGATGFFGSWLLETFVWANRRLDLNAKGAILTRNARKLKERAPHLADSGIDIIIGDVRTFAFPAGEFSHVIHAATESSADLNANHPQLMFDTIVEGTRHCLKFAVNAGSRKFLFTSSGAVYGKQPPNVRMSEECAGGPDPLDPMSAYAEGKRAAELLCVLAAKDTTLEPKIARCFALVGPYMKLDAHFAVGNFIRDQLQDVPICVSGDGTPVRSYMYASDLMVWLWTILFRGESCRAYNVGSEEEISIAELASEIAGFSLRPKPVHILQIPREGSPSTCYVPDTTRARRELGLSCLVPLRAAVERTLQWNAQRSGHDAAVMLGAGR
jgi:nucleoside-diphosphate-sugar epimerase